MSQIGNYLLRKLRCLGCGQASEALELNIQATDELVNPGFEGDYTERGAGEVKIAPGWEPWDTRVTFWPGVVKRPESTPSHSLAHSGKSAQKQFHRYVLWRGGVQQKLRVTPGKWYRFACWPWVYCSTQDNNISKGGRFHARVGVNPWGAWPTHYASVFGKEALKYDKWVQVEVIFQAWSDEVTVFTEGLAEHTVSHNDVYWDDATFEEIDFGAQPQPTPTPGECGFVDRWSEVFDNQAELLLELTRVPKKGDTVTL